MSTKQVHAKVKGNCDPFRRQMKVKVRLAFVFRSIFANFFIRFIVQQFAMNVVVFSA